jgi:hypothetical protein
MITPPQFPHTYRLTARERSPQSLLVTAGIFAAVLLLAFARIYTATSGTPRHNASPAILVTIGASTLACFIVILLRTKSRTELRLNRDAIVLRSAFATRILPYANIAGRRQRIIGRERMPHTLLIPAHGFGGPLVVPWGLDTDAAFTTWLAQLPDLDQMEARAPGIDTARLRARLFNIACLPIAIAIVIYPPLPLALVVLAASLPFAGIALALHSHGLIALTLQRGSGKRPQILAGLLGIAGALIFRAINSNATLLPAPETQTLFLGAAIATLALVSGLVAADRALRAAPAMLITTLLGGIVVFSTVTVANCVTDTGAPNQFGQFVTAKRINQGRKSTNYDITLSPTAVDGLRLNQEVSIPAALYRSVKVGDIVCAQVHAGTLGAPWYRIAHCE